MVGLAHLQRHIRGRFILIWDRSPTQSQESQSVFATHPEIMVEGLPAYAPELNPEEYCHGNVKKRLKNLMPAQVLELRKKVTPALRGYASGET